jgi:hypothetical protein
MSTYVNQLSETLTKLIKEPDTLDDDIKNKMVNMIQHIFSPEDLKKSGLTPEQYVDNLLMRTGIIPGT